MGGEKLAFRECRFHVAIDFLGYLFVPIDAPGLEGDDQRLVLAVVGESANDGRRHQSPTGLSGAVAGALSTPPSMSKCEPWHGQSQQRSNELKCTVQPTCEQVADTL